MIMFHFTLFQQTNSIYGQGYLFYASVVQTFTCITLNPLICTFKGQLYVCKRYISNPSKRPIDTCNFS